MCGKRIPQKCIIQDLHSWRSDDQSDKIFEPEGSFSGVCNSFVNLWYVKNDKNVFQFAFRLLAFPKLLKCWKTTHLKHSIFNTTEKLK